MAQVLRGVFGNRVGRGGARSLGRMARSRRGIRAVRKGRHRRARNLGRAFSTRVGRSGGRRLRGFGTRGYRRAGFGRVGLLASLGALVLGGILGGRRYMKRGNPRIGSRDVSRSQRHPNVPTADY